MEDFLKNLFVLINDYLQSDNDLFIFYFWLFSLEMVLCS